MNKKDVWPFVALLAFLFAWPVLDRMIAQKFFPERVAQAKAAAEQAATQSTDSSGVTPELTAAPDTAFPETTSPPAAQEVAPAPASAAAPTVAAQVETQTSTSSEAEPVSTAKEETAELSNDHADFVFTSRGAGITSVTLKNYRSTLAKDSGPMILDFSDYPALAYTDLPGLSKAYDFSLAAAADGQSVSFERTAASGLKLHRTITIDTNYVLHISDKFTNSGDQNLELPSAILRTGTMRREAGQKDARGVVSLGVDSLSPGGEKVQHWSKKFPKFFDAGKKDGVALPSPASIALVPRPNPVDWVAAKNKYFVQILTPLENVGEHAIIYANRALAPREEVDPSFAPTKLTEVEEVAIGFATLSMPLAPGQTLERESTLYVGPMKYTELYALRLHQVDVMEFGMWAPVGKILLRIMNFIHDHLPLHNYGIAIILLTIIVRVIFWPITHKSTEGMKRMATVAPLVKEIREKYKENPQKQQQEIMALYKEHKVNPIGGCLPMLIQIPVFIALFVVLRTAIELRFADFLWIKDLSEPENLFPGQLPFGFSLNILPILMAVTMYFQMKFSPTAGDPAQQKIMGLMMPAMMLVFLYNFAAGLALYWTTQNLLMIVQQLTMKKKAQAAPAPAHAR